MCTLTVLPRRSGGYGLVMTRDERRTRKPGSPPEVGAARGQAIVAPRDGEAGGSWIVADGGGTTLCMLNGDVAAEEWREPEGVRSRGELLLGLAGVGDRAAIDGELRRRLARGELRVRPFLLVAVEPGGAIGRWQFDGAALTTEQAAPPWIVTSNGLDPAHVARERRQQFDAWLAADGERSLEQQLELHRTHVGAPNDGMLASFCLHRPLVSSVSVTAVLAGGRGVTMRYEGGPPCTRAAASEVHLPCS